jgi:hypothetical protein
MDAATEVRRGTTLSVCLAGMEAGMVGACWMLLWLGVSAKWQQRSFWTAANLMASAFYGGGSIRSGFAWSTVAGLALYLFLYSLLGALFALALHGRVTGRRAVMAGVLFAAGWYFLSYRLLWKGIMPLVALLHTERPTMIGHMIYGAVLGRFPVYFRRLEQPPEETVEPAPQETAALPAVEVAVAAPPPMETTDEPQPEETGAEPPEIEAEPFGAEPAETRQANDPS